MHYCLSVLLILDRIQVIFTIIIGFVTWPPLVLSSDRQKGGQAIITVKITVTIRSNIRSTDKQ